MPYETNPLENPREYHDATGPLNKSVDWSTPGLKVIRLRLLTDDDPRVPFWDVSYCHGLLDGEYVRVRLPFHQLRKGRVISEIIEHAKREKVYAKGLGILDNISKLAG